MLSDETYYDILSVQKDASVQEIASAYRKLAKVLHPDVCNDPDAEELFKTVNLAYHTLRDPKKRAEYDASIILKQPIPIGNYHEGRQQYRDPRTWYYAPRNTPRKKPTHTEVPRRENKKTIPRFFQVILFYLTVLMAIGIFAQLFIIPWTASVNAADARTAFNAGNRWMEEQEYQKAIESFQDATSRLPSFSEAWRAKGLAEVKKGEQLIELKRPDSTEYFKAAIRSFSQVYGKDSEDRVLTINLAKAFINTGEEQRAFSLLSSIRTEETRDPEIQRLLMEASGKAHYQDQT